MPTNSYQLLKDTNAVVNRLEDKMDKRFAEVEARVDLLEDFRGRVLGVTGIVAAVSSIVGTWIWDKLTKRV